MDDTPMNTGEVIVELEKGLRIFKALEKAHEITMALATMEQRTGEMRQSFERELARHTTEMEQAQAELATVGDRVRQDAVQAAVARAEAREQVESLLSSARDKADEIMEQARAEQTRIEGLIHEATLRLMGLRQAVDQLAVEKTTLETQVQTARDAKDALLRA